MLSCFSYLADSDGIDFNNNLIDLMQEAHYNASIWSAFEKNAQINNTQTLIDAFDIRNIDSFIMDYNSEFTYNPEGDLTMTSAGVHTLSAGCSWVFESEYKDASYVYSGDEINDHFFHKFSLPVSANGTVEQDNYASNSFSRKFTANSSVNPDSLHGLQCRWPSTSPGYNSSPGTEYPIIGGEIEFPLWDKSWNENPRDSLLIEFNKLYITFCVKGNPLAPDSVLAAKFKCEVRDSLGNWHFVPMYNILQPASRDTVFSYTFGQIYDTNFSVPYQPAFPTQYRKVTFSIEMQYLVRNHMVENNTWFGRLYGIDPYVYWYGYADLNIDYIGIEDRIHKIQSEPNNLLSNRLNAYTDSYNSKVKRFFSFDEPQPPMFDALSKLNQMEDGTPRKSFTTVNGFKGYLRKPDGNRFSLPKLFITETLPDILLADYYPLEPHLNWNTLVNNSESNDYSLQWMLDWGTLRNYRELKNRCMEEQPQLPFNVVVVSSGKWEFQNNDTGGNWRAYVLPTPQMQTCLQFLPLCYGVSGDHTPFYRPV
jgi:hypothetical protein